MEQGSHQYTIELDFQKPLALQFSPKPIVFVPELVCTRTSCKNTISDRDTISMEQGCDQHGFLKVPSFTICASTRLFTNPIPDPVTFKLQQESHQYGFPVRRDICTSQSLLICSCRPFSSFGPSVQGLGFRVQGSGFRVQDSDLFPPFGLSASALPVSGCEVSREAIERQQVASPWRELQGLVTCCLSL